MVFFLGGGYWIRPAALLSLLVPSKQSCRSLRRGWGGVWGGREGGGGRAGWRLPWARGSPPHLPLSAPGGAGAARLLSERCPGGYGGAEGWELNRERELRKKEEAKEGINSIQLANGDRASPPSFSPAHR